MKQNEGKMKKGYRFLQYQNNIQLLKMLDTFF